MAHNLIYAGIGSREIPKEVCAQMTSIAQQLSPTGWQLRSGHAIGADQAFERGATHKEIHLPWDGYEQAPRTPSYIVPRPTKEIATIAAEHHPKWDTLTSSGKPVLTDTVKLLMCRNVTIVLGLDLITPAKMVICWTPRGKLVGGTSHGIKVAQAFSIPVFNIALAEDQVRLCKFVLQY